MTLRVDWRASVGYAGSGLKWLTAALGVPLAVGIYYGEGLAPFVVTAAVTLGLGLALERAGEVDTLGIRESALLVVLLWVLASVVGALPYVLAGTGTVAQPVNALFESVSGFTTTGATVMADISFARHSRALLLWRQLTQWLGGMGIVVLTVAILPELSIGGMQLVSAEAPGPRAQKLTPRIVDTARGLWKVYAGITAAEVVLLSALHVAGLASGMTLYMSVAHAFTTMATGGFSPAAASIAAFSAAVQWLLVPFMVAAGVNFALFYRALEEGLGAFRRDPEFRFYLGVLGVVSALVAALLVLGRTPVPGAPPDGGGESIVRHAVFQAVSIVTTTGYASVDFATWSEQTQTLLLVAMFLGGSAGSTGSAIKMLRWLVVCKSIRRALFTTAHPSALRSIRVGSETLDEGTVRGIHTFTLLYLLLFLLGTVFVLANGSATSHALTTQEAMSAVAATLGNVGPGVDVVGPMANYLVLPASTKLLLAGLMILGRLEILTVLVLFTNAFWRV